MNLDGYTVEQLLAMAAAFEAMANAYPEREYDQKFCLHQADRCRRQAGVT